MSDNENENGNGLNDDERDNGLNDDEHDNGLNDDVNDNGSNDDENDSGSNHDENDNGSNDDDYHEKASIVEWSYLSFSFCSNSASTAPFCANVTFWRNCECSSEKGLLAAR